MITTPARATIDFKHAWHFSTNAKLMLNAKRTATRQSLCVLPPWWIIYNTPVVLANCILPRWLFSCGVNYKRRNCIVHIFSRFMNRLDSSGVHPLFTDMKPRITPQPGRLASVGRIFQLRGKPGTALCHQWLKPSQRIVCPSTVLQSGNK